jgi:hypothetical protein
MAEDGMEDTRERSEDAPIRKLRRTRAQLLAEMDKLPDDAFVSAKHAAAFIDGSEQGLANWRYERRGPPFFRGGRRFVRYRLGDLRKFMADQAKTTADLSVTITRKSR